MKICLEQEEIMAKINDQYYPLERMIRKIQLDQFEVIVV